MRLPRTQSAEFHPARAAGGAEVVLGVQDEPDNGIEFDPRRDILQEDWEGMKVVLDGLRGKDWWSFSSMARDLSVLAAERAQITRDGQIKITPKKPKLTSEPKPLPERLNID